MAWFQDPDGTIGCDDNNGQGYTGKQAVNLGGIPALNAAGGFAESCGEALSSGRTVQFQKPDGSPQFNGYYVWPRIINDGKTVIKGAGRGYAVTAQTDAGIAWIQQQEQSRRPRPWMCTVSYSTIHTPYQQPPDELYPAGYEWPAHVPEEDSTNTEAIRLVSDLMLSATDKEIGRLLVGAGIATYGSGGELVYDPQASNTVIVIAGDNGTFYISVKAPYNLVRAKGTPYQTGVLAPLIIAGKPVQQPGRAVDSLVDCVDLFQLFADLARVDLARAVPASHILDCQPMLAYLTNPAQETIRRTTFAELGTSLKPPGVRSWPTVFQIGPGFVCNDSLITSKEVADLEKGEWFGPGGLADPPVPSGCEVRDLDIYPSLQILPTSAWQIQNERYKLIRFERAPCDDHLFAYEFYDLTPNPPLNPLGLDNSPFNLVLEEAGPADPLSNLTPDQRANFDSLKEEAEALIASEVFVEGDGNLDKLVDGRDMHGVHKYKGGPSRYDLNLDALTDDADLEIVRSNLRRKP
ncbi:MAG TPA: hypothetical protein VMN36_12595 [Verrucomicrobiales bacterium]|nr:hypothetical protein [Verrucomicrobiales bacterium]